MLWILLGDYASGKSLYLVLEGVSSEREILGNFKLNLDNYSRIDPMDISKIGSNKLLLLDEMQTWLESRVSMSFLNMYVTNLIDQADKRDIDVFGTAHLFSSIDIRFRANVHRIIRCERIGFEGKNFNRVEDTRDFRYNILNTYSGKIKKKRLKYSKAMNYFDLFDTKEIIEYPNQKDLELDLLMKRNPYKALERLMDIADDINQELDGKPFTHIDIELELMNNGYTSKHSKYIYGCLKKMRKLKVPVTKITRVKKKRKKYN